MVLDACTRWGSSYERWAVMVKQSFYLSKQGRRGTAKGDVSAVVISRDETCERCSTWLLKYLLGGLAGVPWVVAQNVSLSCGSG